MASFDTLNYAKWDSLDCSSDDEPQKVRIDPRSHGAATIRADGTKAYSVQMSNGDGPCVVEEDAVQNEGFDSDRPFETQLAWQNTTEKTWIQIALPSKAEASASFHEEDVELRIKGMDPVRLPHPPVIEKDCTYAMGARPFHGSPHPKKCLALELCKKQQKLWPQNVFGGGTSDLLRAGEEIECAWRQGTQMLATTPQEDDWTGAYTWRQDNERVSIWFDVPDDISAKDVDVNCLPRFLTISVRQRKYQRRLTGVCVPSELVWEFDDDIKDRRRLRVEVAMRDLRSWEDGPFLPEMSRKEAQAAATSRSAAPAAAKISRSAAPAAAPATAAPATSASATVSTTTTAQ
ncbi:unnamed protein product [Pelagomonas calceolata]|uniref:CS domain-containing protein n=1 Tax=Pelagomonas calceolata TaxID=35677 RepID=A0A7S4EBF4_9STRA|nr:unnamed protein product [Pelagomonas calceolata]